MRRPWLTSPFFHRRQPAQSLLEVLIAVALMAIMLTVSFLALTGQLGEMSSNEESIEALAFAKEGLEASHLIRDRGWNELATGPHGLVAENNTWRFQDTPDTRGNLTRTITVTDVNPNERLVRSDVSWSINNRSRQTSLSTIITNWRNTVPALLSGNWQNPQSLSSIDIGSGSAATALAVRSGIVYITAQSASNNKSDLFIVDASTPSSPVMRGTLNTGEGLNAIALSGSYAFVVSTDDEAQQLQVISLSNLDSPSLVSSLALGQNDQTALSIAISGTTAYVGTESSSGGPELFVIDISTPTSPIVIGSLEVGATIKRIAIHDNRVVLATSKDSAELIVVDATIATAPVQSGSYNAAGTNNALGLYINSQDGRAYLTRQSGSATDPDVVVLDMTNPDTPSLLGTSSLTTDVNAVFAADTLAFFATSDANQEFKIVEASDPLSLAAYSGLNFPQVAVDLQFENNIIYAAVRSNDALRIITSQ